MVGLTLSVVLLLFIDGTGASVDRRRRPTANVLNHIVPPVAKPPQPTIAPRGRPASNVLNHIFQPVAAPSQSTVAPQGRHAANVLNHIAQPVVNPYQSMSTLQANVPPVLNVNSHIIAAGSNSMQSGYANPVMQNNAPQARNARRHLISPQHNSMSSQLQNNMPGSAQNNMPGSTQNNMPGSAQVPSASGVNYSMFASMLKSFANHIEKVTHAPQNRHGIHVPKCTGTATNAMPAKLKEWLKLAVVEEQIDDPLVLQEAQAFVKTL